MGTRKLQPAFIISAALAGMLLGMVVASDAWTVVMEAFLILLLYMLFVSVDLGAIRKAASDIRFTAAALSLNFVLTPVLSWALGVAFFPNSPEMALGLVMLLVTPCTDWYLVFTGMSRGNVELGLSILPLNLILQIVLLPVYLWLFVGSRVDLDVASMLADMAFVLMVPFMASLATRRLPGGGRAVRVLNDHGDGIRLLFLCLAVVAMFASEGETLAENLSLVLTVFEPLAVFFVALLLTSQTVGKFLGFPYGDRTALTFTAMARNSPLALAVAAAAFPDQPLVALTLVIGPLIELPVLALTSHILLGRAPAEAQR